MNDINVPQSQEYIGIKKTHTQCLNVTRDGREDTQLLVGVN